MVIGNGERLMRWLRQQRLVAIIRLDDLSQAVQLSRAMLQGGLRIQEYTLSNPEALQAIREVRRREKAFENGEALLGVGSVRTVQQVKEAVDAKVDFVVTPTLNSAVIGECQKSDLPILSGAFSPTEIATAWELGSCAVKVFPANALGPDYIKDVLAPMPELSLLPTGGIRLDNIDDYFSAGATAVGVGGSLIDRTALHREDWKAISDLASAYVEKCQVTN